MFIIILYNLITTRCIGQLILCYVLNTCYQSSKISIEYTALLRHQQTKTQLIMSMSLWPNSEARLSRVVVLLGSKVNNIAIITICFYWRLDCYCYLTDRNAEGKRQQGETKRYSVFDFLLYMSCQTIFTHIFVFKITWYVTIWIVICRYTWLLHV
jgi:hypothetical protein